LEISDEVTDNFILRC